jgi:hypothetical protein
MNDAAHRLEYGAIDLRLTAGGRYVFLEINPAGQFVWIEMATGQKIAATLASHLVTGKRREEKPGYHTRGDRRSLKGRKVRSEILLLKCFSNVESFKAKEEAEGGSAWRSGGEPGKVSGERLEQSLNARINAR